MSLLVKGSVLAACGFLLLGCDRTGYESKPTVLKHKSGPVTCQLYTVERTYWDHAIAHPESMSKEDADAICLAEGERQKVEYLAAIKSKK
ncbi:hypothetical protein [Cognatishimia activa]|uniref:Lipoprotein n=1 Tax=Cognatishimia activa TaxID=1715691 RepID=A0A0P1ISB2_9RHOB|nr:hypothetical protein [Cognatishimia activa]MEE2943667.1 hypothetical protein [Pseudomonadota bacterium]CUI65828.1 hypothetical protein TA5113_01068 [Cognatishimia activa]CUK26431.1 hypothetical protein TA5114_02241 [Cognatishimia activa]